MMGFLHIWDQFLFSFEGLDDEGDPKGNYTFLSTWILFNCNQRRQCWCWCTECLTLGLLGSGTTLLQGHGDIATSEMQTTVINGYTCNECSMLSERKEVLTAHSASRVPSSRIYSRDRSQKHTSGKLPSLVFCLDMFYLHQLKLYVLVTFLYMNIRFFSMLLNALNFKRKMLWYLTEFYFYNDLEHNGQFQPALITRVSSFGIRSIHVCLWIF